MSEEWLDEIICPSCGIKHDPNDVLPNNIVHDGEHEDNINCDNCGAIFDCYLRVRYSYSTILVNTK